MTDPKINSSILKFRQELIKTAQSLNLCALALANPQVVRQAPQEPRPDLPPGLDYLNKNADVRANPDLTDAEVEQMAKDINQEQQEMQVGIEFNNF